jgi:hypothetical protein
MRDVDAPLHPADECVLTEDREPRSHDGALHFMYYNFARVHQTLRVTPAMEAGVGSTSGRSEIVGLLDQD